MKYDEIQYRRRKYYQESTIRKISEVPDLPDDIDVSPRHVCLLPRFSCPSPECLVVSSPLLPPLDRHWWLL